MICLRFNGMSVRFDNFILNAQEHGRHHDVVQALRYLHVSLFVFFFTYFRQIKLRTGVFITR